VVEFEETLQRFDAAVSQRNASVVYTIMERMSGVHGSFGVRSNTRAEHRST